MNPVYSALGTTIFTTMSGLATQLGAVNLGQGFPETDGFPEVRREAARALMEASNQYPPMKGMPVLLGAVADFYERRQGLRLEAAHNVLITSGATEAIAAAIFALISEGDEVIVFEPMYDAYKPLIERAGGVCVSVRLSPPDWRFDEAMLTAAFTPRTKAVMITTPNNPTTRMVSREDWDLLAGFVTAHEAYVISDEVWEETVFDGREHVSVLNVLPDHGIKIGSAGKIFALTGWKVGFVCAAASLITQIAKAHQFLTFTTPPALQAGVAFGLGLPDERFIEARNALQASRDYLRDGLEAAGFVTLPADGTYFLNIDLKASGITVSASDFALRAVHEAGVATIPMDAFCEGGASMSVVRLCFSKSDATLQRGLEGLIKARALF
ncbi:MAG: aminotransferase [Asticcacaulis sp.]